MNKVKVFDVCVIGAGPAGIVAALELADQGHSVVLVESGSDTKNEFAQACSNAEIVDLQSHSVMEDAVWRGLGGTSTLWGGRCLPFDPIDFEEHPYVKDSGWPFTESEISPYYQKACNYLGIERPDFQVDDCKQLPTKNNKLTSEFDESEFLRSKSLERWSTAPRLWKSFGNRILNHPNITLYDQLTCVGFTQEDIHAEVKCAQLISTNDQEKKELNAVLARYFIIACGGIESTRLVLNSMQSTNGLKLSGKEFVGKFYMGHLSGKIADVKFLGNPKETIYGFERDGDTYVRRRLTLSEELLKKERLLNIAFWLDNPPLADWRHGSGVLSAAYLGLTMPIIKELLAPAAIRKRVAGNKLENFFKHVFNCIRRPIDTVGFVVSFIWKRYFAQPQIPGFFTFSANNQYALHFHSEQSPSSESTIHITDVADHTGLRQAKVHLKWSIQDIDSVVKAHQVLDQQLRQQKIGELVYRYPSDELENAVRDQSIDGFHQLGTLRLGSDSSRGVCDPFGKLFGTQNVYLASSACFPTSGQANPTFTLVAIVIRQCEHISNLLKSSHHAAP